MMIERINMAEATSTEADPILASLDSAIGANTEAATTTRTTRARITTTEFTDSLSPNGTPEAARPNRERRDWFRGVRNLGSRVAERFRRRPAPRSTEVTSTSSTESAVTTEIVEGVEARAGRRLTAAEIRSLSERIRNGLDNTTFFGKPLRDFAVGFAFGGGVRLISKAAFSTVGWQAGATVGGIAGAVRAADKEVMAQYRSGTIDKVRSVNEIHDEHKRTGRIKEKIISVEAFKAQWKQEFRVLKQIDKRKLLGAVSRGALFGAVGGALGGVVGDWLKDHVSLPEGITNRLLKVNPKMNEWFSSEGANPGAAGTEISDQIARGDVPQNPWTPDESLQPEDAHEHTPDHHPDTPDQGTKPGSFRPDNPPGKPSEVVISDPSQKVTIKLPNGETFTGTTQELQDKFEAAKRAAEVARNAAPAANVDQLLDQKIENIADIKFTVASGDTFFGRLDIPDDALNIDSENWTNLVNGRTKEEVVKDMIFKLARANGQNMASIHPGQTVEVRHLLTEKDWGIVKEAMKTKNADDYWNNVRPRFEDYLKNK